MQKWVKIPDVFLKNHLIFLVYKQSDPMDYFLLDAKTGELRTARPLDRESLPDATGIIVLSVRVRILIQRIKLLD